MIYSEIRFLNLYEDAKSNSTKTGAHKTRKVFLNSLLVLNNNNAHFLYFICKDNLGNEIIDMINDSTEL